MKKAIGIIILSLLLSSNAYAFLIKSGEESLPIITAPPGAQCELKNNKGTWSVVTPGEVIVKRSKQPLTITCIKDGYTKFERFYNLKDPKTELYIGDPIDDSAVILSDLGQGDIFGRGYRIKKIEIDKNFPKYIIDNKEKLKEWIV
jgi:hypothetical protein